MFFWVRYPGRRTQFDLGKWKASLPWAELRNPFGVIFVKGAGSRDAGERSYQVLKYENDPNRIVHFSVWTSIHNAKRFFESPKLVQIRKEAGVKSPDFIYLEELEAGRL